MTVYTEHHECCVVDDHISHITPRYESDSLKRDNDIVQGVKHG